MRNRELRRVELAWGASIVAEWAHFVALGVFAYDAGGTTAVGIAGLARMLPAAVVAPLASSLGDRFRRERVLRRDGARRRLRAGGLGGRLLRGCGKAPLVYALAAVIGITSTLFRPAMQAVLPSLARTPEELIAANGATSTIESLGTLAGPLLAGVLVSVADPGVVFAAAAGTLLAGALLLAPLQCRGRDPADRREPRARARHVLDGVRAVRGPARLILLLMAAQMLRARLPERPDRRGRLPRPRRRRRRCRLPDRRRSGWAAWPARSAR